MRWHWVAAALALWTASGSAAPLRAVGVSVSDLGNPFFVHVAQGVERTAADLGGPGVKVAVASNDYDLGIMERHIDAFVEAGVDLIVLGAADPGSARPAIARARSAGIVVIAVDVAAHGVDATVTSDNVRAGKLACGHIVERLAGTGRMIILSGAPVSSTFDRVKGCHAVLAPHPGIEVLAEVNGGSNRQGALTAMTALLLEHPAVDAVFAINDPTALGADLAARLAGRQELFIVGVDGAPAAVAALQDPDSLLAATVTQDPATMARVAVEIGHRIMQGHSPAVNTVLTPVRLITRENALRYEPWGVPASP